jgi:uncharacterized protein (DUF433 family)
VNPGGRAPGVLRSAGRTERLAETNLGQGRLPAAPPSLLASILYDVRGDTAMETELYVSQREGAYWVGDTRVSLDSIVYEFLNGQTAEGIAEAFPVLSLEQVYGAITYYLGHRAEIDAYLREGRLQYECEREAERRADPAFFRRLANARQHQS